MGGKDVLIGYVGRIPAPVQTKLLAAFLLRTASRGAGRDRAPGPARSGTARILRDLLGSAGFRMIEAHDGEQALRVTRSERPDLILMDIQLPLIDGYEATRSIKGDPELKHVPIIAVTSYALSGDEQKAREAGCDAYVAKPYSTRQLLAKIGQFLEQPQ